MNSQRLKKVMEAMDKNGMQGLVVSDPASIFYLTGKWIHPGERFLVLYLSVEGNHRLFINELFPVHEDLGVEKTWFKDTDEPVDLLMGHIGQDKVIGIDKHWPAKFILKMMENPLGNGGVFLVRNGNRFAEGALIVDRVRMQKDPEEIKLMQEASRLNDFAMRILQSKIDGSHSEKEMEQLLAQIYQELGADGFSFSPIIAFGPNGSDPHHENTDRLLQPGDGIILDIGCTKDSYNADMTRTVFFQEASEKSRKIYNIVKEANERAIQGVRPGVTFASVDAAARDYITEQGYGEFFTHRTGHSIGIDVHDFGDVSSVNQDVLQEGMIFSIEPGIYLPGEMGVRVEDLVLVTKDGCQVLNEVSKNLTII